MPLPDGAALSVDLKAAFLCSQAAAPHMRQAGGGRIVNIASIAGEVPTPFSGVYSASKAAVHAISETLRLELDVEYPGGYALRWSGAAPVGDDGWAVLRVPYNTDEPNGDGRVVARPLWQLGERRGRVLISEADVRAGRRLELRGP